MTTLEELFRNSTSSLKNTNLVQNYGVYVPRNISAQVDTNTPYLGYVKPNNKSTMFINPNRLVDQLTGAETLAHEATHTQQPLSQKYFGNQRIRGIPYQHYSLETDFPNPQEILASLREKEAVKTAGKTIWDTEIGKEWLDRFLQKNKDMTEEGARRYLDLKMFPEHQIMHPLDQSSQGESPGLLQRLFNVFQ